MRRQDCGYCSNVADACITIIKVTAKLNIAVINNFLKTKVGNNVQNFSQYYVLNLNNVHNQNVGLLTWSFSVTAVILNPLRSFPNFSGREFSDPLRDNFFILSFRLNFSFINRPACRQSLVARVYS